MIVTNAKYIFPFSFFWGKGFAISVKKSVLLAKLRKTRRVFLEPTVSAEKFKEWGENSGQLLSKATKWLIKKK